jgi:hypothetical protein
MGVDLGIALDQPRGGERICQLAFELAAQHGLSIFDPQLGRAVTKNDEAAIEERFEQSAAFSVASPISSVGADSPRLSPTTKLWLLVGGVILLLIVASRGISCLL